MRIILSPHAEPYFGQDFTSLSMVNRIGLTPVYLEHGEYNIAHLDFSQVKLIVSRYPDQAADLSFIKSFEGKIPIVLHLHLRFRFLNARQQQRLIEAMSYATVLVANCKMLQEEYEFLFPQYKWLYVNNCVDPFIFNATSIEERFEFRKEYDIGMDRTVLCYTGRLCNAKGLQILEKILEKVSLSENYFICIHTIYMTKYDNIINDIQKKYKNVIIITRQDRKVMRYCDILINCSLCETTSLVNLEALFSGIQVVCTDVTEFYKEIEDEFADFKYFHKIRLDSSSIRNGDGKLNIDLEEHIVSNIANEFMSQVKGCADHSQAQRLTLSESLARSKFNIIYIQKELDTTYNFAVASIGSSSESFSQPLSLSIPANCSLFETDTAS
jgi:glycosyltransferase involved in cell wall biosynthesis